MGVPSVEFISKWQLVGFDNDTKRIYVLGKMKILADAQGTGTYPNEIDSNGVLRAPMNPTKATNTPMPMRANRRMGVPRVP